jgi:hypothetical protein
MEKQAIALLDTLEAGAPRAPLGRGKRAAK